MNHEWDIPAFGLEGLAEEIERHNQELLENRIWVTSDGHSIPISEMDTQHIKNCIHLIYKRNGNWRHQYLRLFEDELRKRKFNKYEL